jgi:hypothetical protein
MIVWREEAWTLDVDTSTTVRRFIERDETISLARLMDYTGVGLPDCCASVQPWVDAGLVEWIRPVSDRPSHELADRGTDLVFCRWRGALDGAYRWEQDFFEGRRSGRNRPAALLENGQP